MGKPIRGSSMSTLGQLLWNGAAGKRISGPQLIPKSAAAPQNTIVRVRFCENQQAVVITISVGAATRSLIAVSAASAG